MHGVPAALPCSPSACCRERVLPAPPPPSRPHPGQQRRLAACLAARPQRQRVGQTHRAGGAHAARHGAAAALAAPGGAAGAGAPHPNAGGVSGRRGEGAGLYCFCGSDGNDCSAGWPSTAKRQAQHACTLPEPCPAHGPLCSFSARPAPDCGDAVADDSQQRSRCFSEMLLCAGSAEQEAVNISQASLQVPLLCLLTCACAQLTVLHSRAPIMGPLARLNCCPSCERPCRRRPRRWSA